MTEPLLLALLGGVAGLVGALLGIGGGVLVVPVLHLVWDLPLAVAVGTSLVVITGTSLAGTAGYLERGLVLTGVALELQLGALVGAVLAAWAAGRLPERLVAALFAAALVWSALTLWWRGRHVTGAEAAAGGGRRLAARALAPLGGAASGLLGIGGGLIHVPILRLLLGLEMRRAVATSTLMVGLTASLAAVVYLRRGAADLALVPWLLGGILAGGAAAPRLGARLPRRALEIAFSLAALYGAFRMVTR